MKRFKEIQYALFLLKREKVLFRNSNLRIKSKDICKKIFINKQIKKISDFKPNKIYLGKNSDNNKILDEVVFYPTFKNPKSYTGEDVIEISCQRIRVYSKFNYSTFN